VDFVYIDGNHLYKYVKEDIKNYWKILKKRGVLSGHDFNSYEHHQDIIKAVVEFTLKNKLKFYVESPDWWIIK